MKTFISFIQKEFRHILRDKRTMLILLGMPIAQILLFGFAISTEVKNSRVAVLDPSGDATTRRIVEQLDASQYFEVAHRVDRIEEVDRLFRRGDIALAVVFSSNFGSELQHTGQARLQLIADGTEPNQAQMVAGYASQVVQSALARSGSGAVSGTSGAVNGGNSAADSASGGAVGRGGGVKTCIRYLFNPQSKSAFNFVPGVMGMILLLICAMMTSVSIVREKETGSMEVLLASPMPPLGIVLAKTVPYFVLSGVNLATILLLSKFVLGVPVQGSLALLLGISLLYILLSLSLGLFISNMVQSQMAAVLVSGMGLIMPTVILSGLMFPIDSMPEILQYISGIVPARWFISAVRKVMIEGVETLHVMKEICVLAGMTVALLTTSILTFRVRL